MPRLGDEVKAFVVQRLACFDTPTRVVEQVKEAYGVELSRQLVQTYDPTKGVPPARKWCALFAATRELYISSAAQIGISHRTFRLEALQRMALEAERLKNYVVAKELHEQAAKEMGNAFTATRRHEMTGANGAPLGQVSTIMFGDQEITF